MDENVLRDLSLRKKRDIAEQYSEIFFELSCLFFFFQFVEKMSAKKGEKKYI